MDEIDKSYTPQASEKKWYAYWESNRLFTAEANSKKPAFSIVLPPPNITGALHMGHALVTTLQDIIVRWKRMQGYETLWLPGLDHAGISTQAVVERYLFAQYGKRRKDYTREEFIQQIYYWKDTYAARIVNQLKQVGCSLDWSRIRFTMDKGSTLAVREVFKKLFDEGLIYRGDYLVNWDPKTQTALADDEVEYEEVDSCLWFLRYALVGEEQSIVVATTRPETLLGDTAVAVSPSDKRFSKLIGREVTIPISGRRVPVIADSAINPGFGSGAVKITPAHDQNDWEIGLRHNLPLITIMTPDGKIRCEVEEFNGLTMGEAREALVKRLRELGAIEKIIPHKHRVGYSYRSRAVIEPYLSKQWFIKMTPFKKHLIHAVESGEVEIIPNHWKQTYYHWINNLRDWCISRQLWWGHQIPIWYNRDNPNQMICYAKEGLPSEVLENPEEWVQDTDVLDTWFSSALWPFSTLGWPEETKDLQKFYPNSMMITGHDILFFWVSRMIFMGDFVMHQFPFKTCFIHGLIYGKSYWRENRGEIAYVSPEERESYELGKPVPEDVHYRWEKMSKSKGNGIDPIEIIETYGADAMRFTLCSLTTHAQQIDLDRRRFEESKHFINKIWNGSRFILMHLKEFSLSSLKSGLHREIFSIEDRWILSSLNRTIESMNESLTNCVFDKAATLMYTFFWDEFCSYYLELSKPSLAHREIAHAKYVNKQKILFLVLLASIRLLHPITPFVSEEIFSLLRERFVDDLIPSHDVTDPYCKDAIHSIQTGSCVIAPYPAVYRKEDIQSDVESDFLKLKEITYRIRNIRGSLSIPLRMPCRVFFISKNESALAFLQKNSHYFTALVAILDIHYTTHMEMPILSSVDLIDGITICIPLPEECKNRELERLSKQKLQHQKQLDTLTSQMANSEFLQKAPAHITQNMDKKIEELKNTLAMLEKKLQEL
ncbi:MAG: valine--tRNA ligase [Chlamydiales bacterium]